MTVMTRVFALLISCVVSPLVFLAAAGLSDVPAWLLVLSLAAWAAVVGALVWQTHFGTRPFDEIKQPLPWSRRSGPPVL